MSHGGLGNLHGRSFQECMRVIEPSACGARMRCMTYVSTFMAGFMSLATPVVASGEYNGLETPRYEVVKTYETGVELRDYEPYSIAHVEVDGTRSRAASKAFRMLAGYIFGGNATEMKMEMTAPVAQVGTEAGWKVSFVLPAKIGAANAPAPNDAAVEIETIEGGEMIVRVFSGRWTERKLNAEEARLRAAAEEAGLLIEPAPIYMFYNDPFTLPARRRNEIGFRVTE